MSLPQSSPPHERGRNLREPLSPRAPACRQAGLCVILEHAVTLAAPFADPPAAPTRRGDQRAFHLRHLSQIPELLRSVDYGGLMRYLSPFRINTSKKSCHLRIAFIVNGFKFTRINTSEKNGSKPPRINTSRKRPGEGGMRPAGRRKNQIRFQRLRSRANV
jgi:hypothetical protein